MALAVVCVFGLSVAPALASVGYGLSGVIGVPGAGAGGLDLAADSGVAVNDVTHDIYVADTENHRVQEFTATGEFVLMFGKDVNKTKVESGVASEAEEDVCTHTEVVMSAVECQAGVSGSTPGAFQAPAFVAVDNASGSEDVYVADTTTHLVQKFTSEGQLIRGWGVEGQLGTTPIIVAEGTGNLTDGSQTIGDLKATAPPNANFHQTQEVSGEGIPPGDLLEPGEHGVGVRLSIPATKTGTGVAITARRSFHYPGSSETFAGLAVDSDGNLWLDTTFQPIVWEFNNGGSFVREFELSAEGRIQEDGGLALDAQGDFYLTGSEGVREFDPEGVPVPLTGVPQASTGLAVDQAVSGVAAGELFVDVGDAVDAFGPSGSASVFGSPRLGAGGGAGLGVDSSVGDAPFSSSVYLANASADEIEAYALALEVVTGSSEGVTASTATLTGSVNPEGGRVVECAFEYGTSVSYGHSVACEPDGAGIGEGDTPVAVRAGVEGLQGTSVYHYRLMVVREDTATHEATTVRGDDEQLVTLPVPVITGGETVDVSESSAVLRASVNPEGLRLSSCVFEYGTSVSYGHVAACEQNRKEIGSGTEPVSVSATLTGLAANVEYHWRLVATNKNGSSLIAPGGSPDHTFIYPVSQASGGCPDEQARRERHSQSLPDCRAYELVTPAQKNAAMIDELALDDVSPQIARDGRRVVTASTQCLADPEACVAIRGSEGDPYEFTRTPAGWTAQGLAPSAAGYESNSWFALNGNGSALFLAPSAPESQTDDWLARSEDGTLTNIGPLGEHAGEPPFAPLPPDYEARAEKGTIATADLSHVVYATRVPVWGFDETQEESASLYEYAGAARAALQVDVEGGFESHRLIGTCGATYGNPEIGEKKGDDSLSGDGRVVFFTVFGHDEKAACKGSAPVVDELYVRVDGEEPGLARSVAISVDPPVGSCGREPCVKNATSGLEDARFEGASADGSGVFFTDTQQLTEAASQSSGSAVTGCWKLSGPGGCNLYESYCPGCQELTAGQEAGRRGLVDVSETNEHTSVVGGPRVQGVVAVSEDGSHVYFVAKGVLTGGEENENHERAEDGAENLYVYAEGRRAFIAQLSAKVAKTDQEERRLDEGEWAAGWLRANVTPDGRFLVFTSTRALTGDDTRAEGPAQVYEYDSVSGRLVRVSVGEDGYDDDGNGGEGDASIVPAGNTVDAATVPVRTDPTMSDDGQFVFFQSPVALTKGALNDVRVPGGGNSQPLDEGFAQNVYEYHDGQVYLISDGADVTDTPGGDSEDLLMPVELFGADAEGGNVFFATFDSLVPEDTDTQRDFYDARVCSEAEPCSAPAVGPPPSCDGEECQGAPSAPPVFGVAGGTFDGPGNLSAPAPEVTAVTKSKPLTRAQKLAKALKACKKDRAKARRKSCEAAARRKYGPKPKKAKKGKKAGRADVERGAR